MTTETYNGWTNYATWGVALVLDNDEGTYNAVREHIAMERGTDESEDYVMPTDEDAVRYRLADWLKDFTEELCGLESEDLSFMARQVLQAGLADVDWDEIARNLLEG
jgi:hypothetical protein